VTVERTERPDLFARRNRLRIVGLVILASVVYWMAICAAVVGTALIGIFWLIGNAGLPDDLQLIKWFLIFLVFVLVLSVVIGSFLSMIRIPGLRRKLERQVLAETGARLANPDDFPEVRNILEALAISAGVPPPRFAVIQDVAPNSFGVGTRPKNTIIGITSGLEYHLTRDELEAVLSYEVSRIGSWDIALSSWAVALTSGAIAAAEADDLKALVGWIPARMAEWLQAWALRDMGEDRDRIAIQFTRHPEALITALEKLESDQGQIIRVSRATAPLWMEVPDGVYGGALSTKSQRLGTRLLLRNRIVLLTELAGLPPRPIPAKTGREPLLPPPPDAPPPPIPILGQVPLVPNPADPYAHLPPPPKDYSHLPPPPTQAPPAQPPVPPPPMPSEDDDPSGGFRVG
jgi:Zn-dependent protease with chaperone function